MSQLPDSRSVRRYTPITNIDSTETNPAEINKCLEQMHRKREYNKRYYQTRVKPKKEQEKHELSLLRQHCAQLEQNQESQALRKEIARLTHQNQQLMDQLRQMKSENLSLSEALEASRQRNYELLMNNASQYLPNIDGLTLNH